MKKIIGYCVKCRAKRRMENVVKTTMKNGRPIKKGTCHKCEIKMCKIGG